MSARGTQLVLVLAAVVALVLAVTTGLARLGWSVGSPPALASHGALFVLGFLGTVIGMERAVALKRRWVWLVPAASATAVLAFLFELTPEVSGLLLIGAGIGLVMVFVVAHRIQPELHIRVMGAGAVCWVIAAVGLWFGEPGHVLVPAMGGFLVLTIFGERLELARIAGVGAISLMWLLTTATILLVGAAAGLAEADMGARISGVGLLGAAGWLAVKDVARRTVRMPGITRYMAGGLLIGYLWLAVAGVIWASAGLTPGTFSYDAAVHALFLGFVFSMVFAHAPVVVPVLTGYSLPYRPGFWAPLILLHLSLLLRVIGDLAVWPTGRMWGGLLNAAAIAVFAALVVTSLLQGHRTHRTRLEQSTGPAIPLGFESHQEGHRLVSEPTSPRPDTPH